jgi:hypothetical protein
MNSEFRVLAKKSVLRFAWFRGSQRPAESIVMALAGLETRPTGTRLAR